MSMETFLVGVLAASTLTGLVTEAIKNILTDYNKTYRPNTLAGVVALFVSAMLGVSYILVTGVSLTAQIAVYFFALVFVSWLCAMVGYDKVMQTISQFKTYNFTSREEK